MRLNILNKDYYAGKQVNVNDKVNQSLNIQHTCDAKSGEDSSEECMAVAAAVDVVLLSGVLTVQHHAPMVA